MTDYPQETADLFAPIHADLAAAKAEIAGLRERLADTQAERDRLLVLLNKALEARPVSIFARIFGRRQ